MDKTLRDEIADLKHTVQALALQLDDLAKQMKQNHTDEHRHRRANY